MPARANALRAAALLALLAACGEPEEPAAPEARPVRVVTIEERAGGDTVSLTGTVQAEIEVDLAFRIDGRMTERLVNVGDQVEAGPGRRQAGSAERGERAARRTGRTRCGEGQLVEAQNNYGRQSALLEDGWTTRVRYDEARQTLETARSRADAAQAQLYTAQNLVGYTELRRGLGRRRHAGRRRARRGRAGRPHDRAGRARGRPRCRLRRAGAGQGPGPCRSRDRGRR